MQPREMPELARDTGRSGIAWDELNYDGFARLAADQSLSKSEKIGFPDGYRAGREEAIFADIRSKLPGLETAGGHVLDIGPGCSDLALMVINLCRDRGHALTIIDSAPMLALLPDEPFIDRRPGMFPNNQRSLTDLLGTVDTILMYSVFQYIFQEADPFDAIDLCLDLLAPGGRALIGDIPNISMRNRFFASPAGVAFHQTFIGRIDVPPPMIDSSAPGLIDDRFIAALLLRIRAAGAHAYIMPQGAGLPMQNRREDMLIWKP